MGFMLYLACMFLFFAYFAYNVVAYSESSSQKYSKRLNKKISLIESASRTEDKTISFKNKGKSFVIRIENVEVAAGLRYETIPAYTCKNIYIDDELVCKIHRLERLFNKAYLAEISNKRHDYEVDELITAAYKKAKQIDKAYWKERFAKEHKENSFYDTKAN